MKSALFVWGGWDGHQPKEVSEIFEKELKAKGLEVNKIESSSEAGNQSMLQGESEKLEAIVIVTKDAKTQEVRAMITCSVKK